MDILVVCCYISSMSHRLPPQERADKYREEMMFPNQEAMLEALGLKGHFCKIDLNFGHYGFTEWRYNNITRKGFPMVEFAQNKNGKCVITKLFRLVPQFDYGYVAPRVYRDFKTGQWVSEDHPSASLIGTRTNVHQILDLDYHGLIEAFQHNATPLTAFKVLKRIRKGVKRFKESVDQMMAWMMRPNDTDAKAWHEIRRTLKQKKEATK